MHTRTRARRFASVLFVGAALGASPVFSATIYSNFGPGDSYNSGAAYGIGPVFSFNSIVGESFVPGSNFQFSGARLALAAPGLGGSQTGVYLEDDNGGIRAPSSTAWWNRVRFWAAPALSSRSIAPRVLI